MLLFCKAVYAIDLFEDDEDIIWRAGLNVYFKYADQDASTFGENDHPVDLPEKDINLALRSLTFTEKSLLSRERIRTVFSGLQENLLSKHLAQGLRNAKPGQDIVFVMEGGSRKLILLSERNFVAGRAFFKEGKLNIIIGDYDRSRNDAFESVYDPSGRAAVPYSFNYGRRSKGSNRIEGSVIAVPGVENKNFGKRLRKDWFVVDVATASQAFLANANRRSNPVTEQNQNIRIEAAAKLARERREMRAEMARMRKEMKALSTQAPSSKAIEERIATLEQLRKKELITQEEYDSRRKEILDDI